MPKIIFSGVNTYIEQLKRLGMAVEDTAKEAVYNGAGVIADEVRVSLAKIQTDETWGTDNSLKQGIMHKQKEGLLNSLGISPISYDGDFLNAKIGFAGYNNFKTDIYPNGQPNQMVANSAESGTSFMVKTPFFASAVRRAKPMAEKKMKEVFENKISKNVKE